MALYCVETGQFNEHKLHIFEEYSILCIIRVIFDEVFVVRRLLNLLLPVKEEVQFLLLRQLFDMLEVLRHLAVNRRHWYIFRIEKILLFAHELDVVQQHLATLRILNREELAIVHHEVVEEDHVVQPQTHTIERAVVLLFLRARSEHLVYDGRQRRLQVNIERQVEQLTPKLHDLLLLRLVQFI